MIVWWEETKQMGLIKSWEVITVKNAKDANTELQGRSRQQNNPTGGSLFGIFSNTIIMSRLAHHTHQIKVIYSENHNLIFSKNKIIY